MLVSQTRRNWKDLVKTWTEIGNRNSKASYLIYIIENWYVSRSQPRKESKSFFARFWLYATYRVGHFQITLLLLACE